MESKVNRSASPLRNNAAILAILTVLIMTVLDVTVMNVALPIMAADFSISDSQTVWIVTIYQMAIVMLLLPVSSYGDIFSYKRTFLFGVFVFTIASIGCAAADSFLMIVLSRGLQGIGGACIMGVNIALMRLIYPKEILGRGMALNAMVIAVSTAAGPTLAGAILSIASWHWLFLINIPLGILAFVLGKRLLPENPVSYKEQSFDWKSALCNMIFFGSLFFAIGGLSSRATIIRSLILALLAIFTGIYYIRRQRNKVHPLLPLDLCRIPLFSLSLCTSVCSFVAQIVAMISLPFLFITYCGFSEVTTGLLMTPWPIATMLMSPVAARLAEKFNPGIIASLGMAIFFSGLTALSLLTFDSAPYSEWDIVWRMVICGIGFGMYQTPNNLVMVTATPIERTGGAGGLQSTARLVGQTFGASLVTLIFAYNKGISSVRTTLFAAVGFAVIATIVSSTRYSRVNLNN